MTSETQTRTVFRMFSAWNDEKKEAWLSEMAGQGWHLRSTRIHFFTFEKGAPAEVVYKLDYHRLRSSEREEYVGLFRSSGWEHVCECSGWQYFRTPAVAGASPDIFSDTESKAAKYRRLLGGLMILIPIMSITVNNLLRNTRTNAPYYLTMAALTVMVLLWSYSVARLARRIWVLRQSRRS
jgi:hypothetical protein